jgi:hypothetical protein
VSNWERFNRGIALFSIGFIFLPAILKSAPALLDLLGSKLSLSPWQFLFVLNYDDIVPLYLINLISALITLGIWISLNDFENDILFAKRDHEISHQMQNRARNIERGLRVRNAIAVVFYFFFLIYCIFWLHPQAVEHVPNFLLEILTYIYGYKTPINIR